MSGSDETILGKDLQIREKVVGRRGRSRVSRDLLEKMLLLGHDRKYIRKVLKCSSRTIRRYELEMLKKGQIALPTEEEKREIAILGMEFEAECKRAAGISFHEWLKSKTTQYQQIYTFCRRVYERVWERPSLALFRERNVTYADELTMKFLSLFGQDEKRIRRRKKYIRYLYRFLGRMDICDKSLTMTKSRDPEEIREIPELTLISFPSLLDKCINEVGLNPSLGEEYKTALQFKLCTQMRTGGQDRELMGIKCGEPNGSWILFDNGQMRGEIIGKSREKWVLQWLPREVKDRVAELYATRAKGECLFKIDIHKLRKEFTIITEKSGLTPMKLHDLRKVAITWFWAMGIDLSIATELNVGWKDLNTAKKHYLRMGNLVRKSERIAYRDSIPEWFKEGLEEYTF